MPVIAITGLPGSGSSTIARLLAEKLKVKYFSPGEYFKSHSIAKHQTKQVLSVWLSKEGTKKRFHEDIDKMQVKLAKKGNVVICGKLSIYMLKDIADYKIWIKCAADERAKRTAERDGISFEEAKKSILEREKIEAKEWRKDYGIDYREQERMADIVIDTSNMSKEKTIEKLMSCINQAL
ncbi:MAG: (d)CMP kinase [bacterium]